MAIGITVLIVDATNLIHLNSAPTMRTVRLELDQEQLEQLKLKDHESYGQALVEELVPLGESERKIRQLEARLEMQERIHKISGRAQEKYIKHLLSQLAEMRSQAQPPIEITIERPDAGAIMAQIMEQAENRINRESTVVVDVEQTPSESPESSTLNDDIPF